MAADAAVAVAAEDSAGKRPRKAPQLFEPDPGELPSEQRRSPAVALPSREACNYTSCYCEENVFLLIRTLVEQRVAGLDELFTVFISNEAKSVGGLAAAVAQPHLA